MLKLASANKFSGSTTLILSKDWVRGASELSIWSLKLILIPMKLNYSQSSALAKEPSSKSLYLGDISNKKSLFSKIWTILT